MGISLLSSGDAEQTVYLVRGRDEP